ncbi:MAG: hypothetical protein ACRC5M_03620 [Anaeroplasmataceae bacterium]
MPNIRIDKRTVNLSKSRKEYLSGEDTANGHKQGLVLHSKLFEDFIYNDTSIKFKTHQEFQIPLPLELYDKNLSSDQWDDIANRFRSVLNYDNVATAIHYRNETSGRTKNNNLHIHVGYIDRDINTCSDYARYDESNHIPYAINLATGKLIKKRDFKEEKINHLKIEIGDIKLNFDKIDSTIIKQMEELNKLCRKRSLDDVDTKSTEELKKKIIARVQQKSITSINVGKRLEPQKYKTKTEVRELIKDYKKSLAEVMNGIVKDYELNDTLEKYGKYTIGNKFEQYKELNLQIEEKTNELLELEEKKYELNKDIHELSSYDKSTLKEDYILQNKKDWENSIRVETANIIESEIKSIFTSIEFDEIKVALDQVNGNLLSKTFDYIRKNNQETVVIKKEMELFLKQNEEYTDDSIKNSGIFTRLKRFFTNFKEKKKEFDITVTDYEYKLNQLTKDKSDLQIQLDNIKRKEEKLKKIQEELDLERNLFTKNQKELEIRSINLESALNKVSEKNFFGKTTTTLEQAVAIYIDNFSDKVFDFDDETKNRIKGIDESKSLLSNLLSLLESYSSLKEDLGITSFKGIDTFEWARIVLEDNKELVEEKEKLDESIKTFKNDFRNILDLDDELTAEDVANWVNDTKERIIKRANNTIYNYTKKNLSEYIDNIDIKDLEEHQILELRYNLHYNLNKVISRDKNPYLAIQELKEDYIEELKNPKPTYQEPMEANRTIKKEKRIGRGR